MAVLKHLASKSANYGNVVRYLMFQHDTLTGRPLIENGCLVMRENILIDGIECDPGTFELECDELNRKYHKNNTYSEIKSHHYIISFDPKDATDGLMTVEKAQEIGMKYATENFPGHQAIVCTHPDGENHSGNIHVHIVINSLRKKDVPHKSFMERKSDTKAGFKHHLTLRYLAYLKQNLMEICHTLGLHQVDLLSPAREKVTDREQYAKARGQKALGEEKGEEKTEFHTQKDDLRTAIRAAAKTARSEKEFATILKSEYGITLKISRGRYGYIHPDRARPIRGRMLGTDYIEDHLKEVFEANRQRPSHPEKAPESPVINTQGQICEPSRTDHSQDSSILNPTGTNNTRKPSILDQLHSLETQVTLTSTTHSYHKQPSRQARITALKETAESVAYLQEHGYKSLDEAKTALKNTRSVMEQLKLADIIRHVEKMLNEPALDERIIKKRDIQEL